MYNNRDSRPTSNRSFGPRRDFGGSRGGGREERQMFEATCDKCGRSCQLPFRPNGTKPVYCSNCFEKQGDNFESRGASDNRYGGDRPFVSSKPRIEARSYDGPDYGRQINELSAKLDKIISMLAGEAAPAKKIKKEKKVLVAEENPVPEVIAE